MVSHLSFRSSNNPDYPNLNFLTFKHGLSKKFDNRIGSIFECFDFELLLYKYDGDLKFGQVWIFEWLKRGWVANSQDFKWDVKSGQMVAILSKTI